MSQCSPDIATDPQYIVEGIILRRLHQKRIEGYTIEMAKEIVAVFIREDAQARADFRWWRNMAIILLCVIAAALAFIFVPIIRWGI